VAEFPRIFFVEHRDIGVGITHALKKIIKTLARYNTDNIALVTITVLSQ